MVIGSGLFVYFGILVGINVVKEFGGLLVLGGLVGILVINFVVVDIKFFGEVFLLGWGGLIGVLFVVIFMVMLEKWVCKFVF